MSRGIGKQQREVLAVVQALISERPIQYDGRGLRRVSTYDVVRAMYHTGGADRSRRPGALILGECTPSQQRSLQRSLRGLVQRGLLRAERGIGGHGCLEYWTAEEHERWDTDWGGADARRASFERLLATSRKG
ncbi:MAG: hypothetical protein IH609_11860 [Dehalococcoidia bacterium]|nr:hypothetical protein [Dehalococcoidia bacterium]